MQFKSYNEYKDSGVEWLGDVPAHWKVIAPKRLGEFKGGAGFPHEYQGKDSGDYPFYKVNALAKHYKYLTNSNDRVSIEDAKKLGAKAFELNSIFFAKVGAALLLKRIRLNREVCCVDNNMMGFTPSLHHSSNFLYYGFHQIKFDYLFNGGAVPSVNEEQVSNFLFAIPHREEQNQIASFLDQETSKIDLLISKQENLIELLEEQRKSIISHAVTKGLDPDAPMKDSGVEWLGDVPAHWDVLKIKRLSPVKRGASPRPIDDPKYFDDSGEYAWVRISDVTKSEGVLLETTQRLSNIGAQYSVQLEPGALFLSIAATVGEPCIAAIKACIHDGFIYFPLLKRSKFLLFNIFKSKLCFIGLGKMGTQLNLNTETIENICVALPPRDEEKAIIRFIDQETSKIDITIDKQKLLIEKLKEYRSSVISHAVTGKIDVRDLAT